jgi:DNA-binding NarL/FixJ family response regulator
MALTRIKIVITDDYLLLRTAWKLLLQSHPDFEVVATLADGRATINFIRSHPVDVVLMDINMPGLNGIDATAEIDNMAPWIKVIGLSMHSEYHFIHKLLKAGARGFVSKSADKEELFRAILDVHNNIPYISPSVSPAFIKNLKEGTGRLTERELAIVKYLVQGFTSRQIGAELCISFKTVEAHKYNVFKKLEVGSTAAMTKKVLEKGIIIP